MVAINADMTFDQDWLPIEHADHVREGLYQLDDELVQVHAPRRAGGRFIDRGWAGSAAASHSSGATLTRYYPDAPGGGDGIPQGGPYSGVLAAEDASARVGNTLPLLASGTTPVPTFFGPDDPRDDEDLLAQMQVGAVWQQSLDDAVIHEWEAVEGEAEGTFDWHSKALRWLDPTGQTGIRLTYLADNFAIEQITDGTTTFIVNVSPSGISIQKGDSTASIALSDSEIGFLVSGNLVINGLPTADPEVEGALWNDAGTVKVSAGA